jgi:hypothetical protein
MCPNSCEATGQLTLYPTGGDKYGISDKQPRSGNDGDVGAQNLGATAASERGLAATSAGPSRTGPSLVRRCRVSARRVTVRSHGRWVGWLSVGVCWLSARGATAESHGRPDTKAAILRSQSRPAAAPNAAPTAVAAAGARRWHPTGPRPQPQSPPRLSAGAADCARLRHRRRRNRQGTPAACRARHRHQVHPM